MSDIELPELPQSNVGLVSSDQTNFQFPIKISGNSVYTEDQTCEYARVAVEMDRKRCGFMNLQPIIDWLENECDPKMAAKELRLLQGEIGQSLAQPAQAAVSQLSFIIEMRAGIQILVEKEGGCRPASDQEYEMWKMLNAAPDSKKDGS